MSGYLQELVTYLGSSYVFEEASEVLDRFLSIDVPAKQVERVSEKIGTILQATSQTQAVAATTLQAHQNVFTYVQMDGSMVLTRADKWREVKLGRIFQLPTDEAATKDKHPPITHSEYVGHLGKSKTFLTQLQQHIPQVKCPIFIADGAPWIWHWIDKNYPNSIQILDYYHAMEYVHDFARVAFAEEKGRKSWVKGVENYLFTNRIAGLLWHFRYLATQAKGEVLEQLDKLLHYFETHQHRMYYGFYREKGLLIGSGAIEAAHREVIQKRMKLSGQRWSIEGAKAMLELRVTKKSDKWEKVIQLTKQGKLAA